MHGRIYSCQHSTFCLDSRKPFVPPLFSRARHSVAVSANQTQQSPPPQRPTPSGRITPANAPPQQFQQYQQQGGGNWPPPPPGQGPKDVARDVLNNYAKALIAGAFVCGLGVGVYYDSEVVLSPQNLSSTQIIDRGSPNADLCMAYGEPLLSPCEPNSYLQQAVVLTSSMLDHRLQLIGFRHEALRHLQPLQRECDAV